MNTIPENTIESIKNLDAETIQAVNNYYLNVGQFKPKQEKNQWIPGRKTAPESNMSVIPSRPQG